AGACSTSASASGSTGSRERDGDTANGDTALKQCPLLQAAPQKWGHCFKAVSPSWAVSPSLRRRNHDRSRDDRVFLARADDFRGILPGVLREVARLRLRDLLAVEGADDGHLLAARVRRHEEAVVRKGH